MHRMALFFSVFWVVAHGGAVPEPWCDNEEAIHYVYNVGKHHCDCNTKNEGSLKYADGKLFVCNGNEWSALKYEGELGSKARPGLSCQNILEKSKAKLHNGVYFIRLKGEVDPFPVYCDMESGGYTMVFKAVGGNNKDIYSTYSSDKTSAEEVEEALDVTNRYTGEHYKNRIMLKDNWAKFDPSMVKIVLFKGGKEVLSLSFDAQFSGKSSDYLNWFSASKLVSYPWPDLKYERKNYFSIKGGCHPLCRDFFINRNYGGCHVDAGWLATTGKACNWEKARPWPAILYSKKDSYTKWNMAESVGVADVLAVFVKEEHHGAAGPRGSRENPGQSCKEILTTRHGHANTNGIFWIKLNWEADPFQVYCDMKSGGYTLVFKAISGNGQNVLTTYKSQSPANEHRTEAMSVTNTFKSHYKNRILLDSNWKKFDPSSVKVVLYTGGQEKIAMKFDGKASNYLNWFSDAKLLSSPYTDIKSERKNFFSIDGDSGLRRYFYINRNYGGCKVDVGWLVITGTVCSWEKRFSYPSVIYSKEKTRINWNVHGNVGLAEVMAVYVQ